MDDRQKAELEFWRRDYEKYRGQDYAKVRASNLDRIRERWPDIDTLEGRGVEVGCGACSMFEGSGLEIFALDPLMEEYGKFCNRPGDGVVYVENYVDNGKLPFTNGFTDYIFCINVIDHTEHWRKLLVEMRRVLREHGLLFFQANFDWYLQEPEHTRVWTWGLVENEVCSLFFPERQTVIWDYDSQRFTYWGKFVKSS
jgi:SAM-dependent methyltransferase